MTSYLDTCHHEPSSKHNWPKEEGHISLTKKKRSSRGQRLKILGPAGHPGTASGEAGGSHMDPKHRIQWEPWEHGPGTPCPRVSRPVVCQSQLAPVWENWWFKFQEFGKPGVKLLAAWNWLCGRIYTIETDKCYYSGLLFSESQSLNL